MNRRRGFCGCCSLFLKYKIICVVNLFFEGIQKSFIDLFSLKRIFFFKSIFISKHFSKSKNQMIEFLFGSETTFTVVIG